MYRFVYVFLMGTLLLGGCAHLSNKKSRGQESIYALHPEVVVMADNVPEDLLPRDDSDYELSQPQSIQAIKKDLDAPTLPGWSGFPKPPVFTEDEQSNADYIISELVKYIKTLRVVGESYHNQVAQYRNQYYEFLRDQYQAVQNDN